MQSSYQFFKQWVTKLAQMQWPPQFPGSNATGCPTLASLMILQHSFPKLQGYPSKACHHWYPSAQEFFCYWWLRAHGTGHSTLAAAVAITWASPPFRDVDWDIQWQLSLPHIVPGVLYWGFPQWGPKTLPFDTAILQLHHLAWPKDWKPWVRILPSVSRWVNCAKEMTCTYIMTLFKPGWCHV